MIGGGLLSFWEAPFSFHLRTRDRPGDQRRAGEGDRRRQIDVVFDLEVFGCWGTRLLGWMNQPWSFSGVSRFPGENHLSARSLTLRGPLARIRFESLMMRRAADERSADKVVVRAPNRGNWLRDGNLVEADPAAGVRTH